MNIDLCRLLLQDPTVPKVLRSPKAIPLMEAYIRSAVRYELLMTMAPGTDLVLNEADLLKERWEELRKWTASLGLTDTSTRKRIVRFLQGLALATIESHPEVPKVKMTTAIHHVLAKGFAGLFEDSEPESSPSC